MCGLSTTHRGVRLNRFTDMVTKMPRGYSAATSGMATEGIELMSRLMSWAVYASVNYFPCMEPVQGEMPEPLERTFDILSLYEAP